MSSPPHKKSRNDDLVLPSDATGYVSPPSPSSPFCSVEPMETDVVSQDTEILSVSESLKARYHREFGSESPRLDSLSGRPLDRIFDNLYTDGDCMDLANLTLVSKPFRRDVKTFMMRKKMAIEHVTILKIQGVLEMRIDLFPSNIPFYNKDDFDRSRFKRIVRTLIVKLRGSDDPIIEQVLGLLSTSVKGVNLENWGREGLFSSSDLTLVERLLRYSSIDELYFHEQIIDDSSAPLIISIISASSPKDINITWDEQSQLSDPASFVTQLFSVSSSVFLHCYTPLFFGLTRSFWEKFLNEKLSVGSFDYLQVGNMDGAIYEAPINLSDSPMRFLMWKKTAN